MTYPPTKIEVFRPSIGEEEIDAVASVMRSGWLGRGPKVEEFESEWARHIGVDKANVVSVGCATEGLYQVMQWISGAREREIIIPDNSFIGTASAVLESGMTLKLADINERTLNPDKRNYQRLGTPLIAGIVYQHYGGFEAEWDDTSETYQQWKVPIIEDFACHPLGKPSGEFAIYSFDAMKVITCGDGGIVYCKDTRAVEAIRQATRLGMHTASGKESVSGKWWEYTASWPGRRSIMNDIGAAIGLVQLKRLPELVERRQQIWRDYQYLLREGDGTWYWTPPNSLLQGDAPASYYTFWLTTVEAEHRDRLAHYLRERGIYSTYRYESVHRAYGWKDVSCPNSEWANDHVLNIPLHPGLTDSDVEFVCDTIKEFGETL